MSEQDLPKGKKVTEAHQGVDIAPGAESAPEAEASGHAAPSYVCWNDGAINWVAPGVQFFICWRDGALNQTY